MTQALMDFSAPKPVVEKPLAVAISQGRAAAKVCSENARKEVSDWPEKAAAALQQFIYQQKAYDRGLLFTAEEAVAYCYGHHLPKPHDERAWGSTFTKAARLGLIKRSSVTYQRAKGHGSLGVKWEIVVKPVEP